MSDQPIPAGYRIDDIEIDVVRRRVCRGDSELSLGKLTYELLVALAEAASVSGPFDEIVEQLECLTRRQCVDIELA